MRTLAIIFTILLPFGCFAIDYANHEVTCAISPPAGRFESPILIEHSLCTPYGTFSLVMEDITITATTQDATTGSLLQNYPDATLVVNGTTYKSESIQFRSEAEHVLFDSDNKRELEIQIYMTSTSAIPVMLSFLVKQVGDNELPGISNSNNFKILQNSGGQLKLNFKDFSTRLMNKQAEEIFLNMFTYEGTTTYSCMPVTWFVYGSEFTAIEATIDLIQNVIDDFANVATSGNQMYNSKPYDSSLAYGGGGVQSITRLCYTGYFKNYISDNYGLWFGVGSILLFFIVTLSLGEKPIRAYDYVENVWTHHPFVSIYKYGNEIHTRKQRMALFLCMFTIHALFSSVFYRDATNKSEPSNTIVFAIYSMLINWVITFFLGNVLRGYYEAKYEFHKTKEDNWDQKAQNRLFAFYFSVFVIICVGWPFTTWNMGELYPEIDEQPSKLWVASIFIGLAMELIVFYPLVCILARGSNFVRRIARNQAFMYDKICHETYLDYVKSD